MEDFYDIIVVGSGASGAVVSHYLSEKGLRVCCIEKGEEIKTNKMPSNFFNWEFHKRREFSFNPNIRSNDSDYSIDCDESIIDIANFNGVGGSTALFSAHYPRFHPSDFKVKSNDNVAYDWPLSYEDLVPHYVENEKYLNVSGLPGDPCYPDFMEHLKNSIDIGECGDRIVKAFKELNWHYWPSYSAILNFDKDDRKGCTNIGLCNTGCPTGSKSSADVTFISDAIKYGLVLLKNTTVTEVVTKNGVCVGVLCIDKSGKKFKLNSKKVVLASNAIGSLRILWNSSKKNDFLANKSNQIGKNFMIHPLGYVEGYLPGCKDANIGPQGSWLASHEFYDTDKNRGFIRGFSMHFLKNIGPSELCFNSILRKKVKDSHDILSYVKDRISNTIGIAIICEDLPISSNRIEMTNRIDKDSLPIPKVFYSLDANTKKMMSFGMSKAKLLLKQSGAKDIFGSGPVRFAGWHLTGTTRMGDNPSDSVVNKFGESHDIKNLFIADGGIFTTSSGVNPASTIQAVARHIAENIYVNFKKTF